MEPTDRYIPRSRDVASEDFDGEFVVLDLESGKYYSLLSGSAIVWRALLAGHSHATMTAGIAAGDLRRQEIADLIAKLVEHNLIVASTTPGAEAPQAVVDELTASSGPFAVEMFDDLADLLVADPVHDVDQETGWPVLPPSQD